MPNNNLSPLPFYTDIAKQNHRKNYAFGEIFPLFTPNKKILPFQIIRDHRADTIDTVNLYKRDGTLVADITSQLVSNGLVIRDYTTYDIIVYPGILQLTTNTPEGQYYISITDGVETWYSDIFTIVRFMDTYIQLIYWDEEDLIFDDGRIDFTNSFKFHIFLPTQVGKPDYEFEEQLENRDGFSFIEKQISKKTYKFNFIAPEYLLDAMRIIRMMDSIQIYAGGENYYADQFLMTPKWESGNYLASVEVEFQTDTVVKKIGRTYVIPENGDFNIDFNNDYSGGGS